MVNEQCEAPPAEVFVHLGIPKTNAKASFSNAHFFYEMRMLLASRFHLAGDVTIRFRCRRQMHRGSW